MGCGSCGVDEGGKVSGCGSKGGCSSGGCNRMNVFDWLSDIPLNDHAKPYPIIEVSFNKGSRKEFFRNTNTDVLEKGEMIAVEGVGGFDVGQVSLTGELVKLQMKKYATQEHEVSKKILRYATNEDIDAWEKQKQREQETMVRSRAMAKALNLEMKICEVEFQADGKKATFFYTADQRVDFREMIKVLASEFRVKVEMRQIGARQESAKVGGIGSCGRELCCSTWLTDFKSVNTTAARYQNLSINQTKLSGQCGRLKCCLNYELDTYMDALRIFPDSADVLQTQKGPAFLQKRDIFKSLMWYSYQNSNKLYPLTIKQVKEVQEQNKKGEKPEELQAAELDLTIEKNKIKVADMGFVNDVGQMTIKSLEKTQKKKKHGSTPGGMPGNAPQQQQRGERGDRSGRPGGNVPERRQEGTGQQQNSNKHKQQQRQPQQAQPQQQGGRQPQGKQLQQQQNKQSQQPQPQQPDRVQQPQSNRPQQQHKKQNQPQQQGREPQQRPAPTKPGGRRQGSNPPRNNDSASKESATPEG